MDPNRMEMFELPNLFGHFIREFGVRWFCVIGAVVMAVIFGMRLSVALEPEPVQNPSGQYLRNDYGGAGTTVPEEKRYATEEAVRQFQEGFSDDFAAQVACYSAPSTENVSCVLESG